MFPSHAGNISTCVRVCVFRDGLWDGRDFCNYMWTMFLSLFSGLGLDCARVLLYGPSFWEWGPAKGGVPEGLLLCPGLLGLGLPAGAGPPAPLGSLVLTS